MILAGDIGGTKTILGFFDDAAGSLRLLDFKTFPSADYRGLEDIVLEYVQASRNVTHACFGVAGPISEGRVQTSNLPWVVEAEKIASLLKIHSAILINDLEATAYGIATLNDDSLLTVNRGKAVAGNQAVVAAGTGLGEAFLYWDGQNHLPAASEGGHTDFAPRTGLEMELLNYLQKKFEHVSYERILSGPGLFNIYQFLRDTGKGDEPPSLRARIEGADPGAAISQAALEGFSKLATDALSLFVAIYGAEAGNLALKTMALGGVFIGGGIAPKIREKLLDGEFMRAFADKGRFKELMRSIPVHIILDDKAALRGAARRASMERKRKIDSK
jgi:glucokinase